MIHLKKSVSIQGYKFAPISCTNDPFVRGRAVDKDEFHKSMEEGKRVCKKCLKQLIKTL